MTSFIVVLALLLLVSSTATASTLSKLTLTTQNLHGGGIGSGGGGGGGSKCHASLEESTTQVQSAAALHFGGYNQNLGLAQHHQFSDEGVQESLQRVPVGGIRFPGGSVANYYNFTSGDYVKPCDLANISGWAGRICHAEELIDEWPVGTTSVSNFYGNISTKMFAGAGNVVYCLNLLTMATLKDITDQVDALMAQVPHQDIRFIELGNEYYLKTYIQRFPNATVYMQLATQVAAYIHKKLPHTAVSYVCTNKRYLGSGAWDLGVAGYDVRPAGGNGSSYRPVEYITIHDYTLTAHPKRGKPVTKSMFSETVLWGYYQVPMLVKETHEAFTRKGKPLPKILFSEFDVWTSFDPFLAVTALRGMFALNFQTASFCATNQSVAVSFLHILWGNPQGGGHDMITVGLQTEVGKDKKNVSNTPPSYSAVSQILAHVSAEGPKKHSEATCLSFAPTTSTGCGTPYDLHREHQRSVTLNCVHGMMFSSPSTTSKLEGVSGFTAMLINGCDEEVTISLSLPTLSSSTDPEIADSKKLNVTSYHYAHYHRFEVPSDDPSYAGEGFVTYGPGCSGELWAQDPSSGTPCGKYMTAPNVTRSTIRHEAGTMDVWLPPLSLKLIVV